MTKNPSGDESGKFENPFAHVAAKRPAPPKIAPIVFEGVRYEQSGDGDRGEDSQRSGFLAAYRGDTDELLWRVQVYKVDVNEKLERDVQQVYFSKMELRADERQILIENEIGERFRVDLDDGSVTPAD